MRLAWFSGVAARWSAAGTIITVKTNTALGVLLAGAALILLVLSLMLEPRCLRIKQVGASLSP